MKTTDLMIGDWVQYTEDQWLTEEDSLPRKITGLGNPRYPSYYPYIRIEGMNEDYHIDLFQPIPISPEILEKNGFLKREEGTEVWYDIKIDKDNIIGVAGFENTGHWVFGCSFFPNLIEHIGIEYVHELQHALKLCGIEKEINF